jgi:hypothetical protein
VPGAPLDPAVSDSTTYDASTDATDATVAAGTGATTDATTGHAQPDPGEPG